MLLLLLLLWRRSAGVHAFRERERERVIAGRFVDIAVSFAGLMTVYSSGDVEGGKSKGLYTFGHGGYSVCAARSDLFIPCLFLKKHKNNSNK